MSLNRNAALSLAATLTLFSARPARASTPDDIRTHIAQLQTLTTACAASATACDASQIGADETLGDPTQPGGYTVTWGWLHSALESAAKAKPEDRTKSMQQSQARLASLLADLNAQPAADHFNDAHAAVTKTLSADEFHNDEPVTWWDRLKAKFWGWIARAFEGLDAVAGNRPWIGKALAGLFFLAAAVGFVLFLRRQIADSRLRVKLNETAGQVSGWARESTAWAELAEQRAAEGDFREAVHCLYWAGIVLLEGRRAWRHDPSRTPREYVRLLPAGSAQRDHLRALTALFERLWYGLREATAADYSAAREHFLALDSARTAAPANITPEAA